MIVWSQVCKCEHMGFGGWRVKGGGGISGLKNDYRVNDGDVREVE